MSEEKQNEGTTNIQDENLEATKSEDSFRTREFYGPVYIDQYWADNKGSYYIVRDEDRDKLPEKAYGARVAPQNAALANLMSSAFNLGKPVSVDPRNRWWIGPGKFVWTIARAKVGF
jgi:hypothetical protein